MKKLFIFTIGLVFIFSITALPSAQEKTKAAKSGEPVKSEPAKPGVPTGVAKAEPSKPEKTKKEAPAKPALDRMGGIVTALDQAGKTITLQQGSVHKERKVKLSLSKAAANALSGIKVGDAVNVWMKGKLVTSLQKAF